MAELASNVTVDLRTGKVYIDGEELPWEISADTGVTISVADPKSPDVHAVVIGILADDVKVIPADAPQQP